MNVAHSRAIEAARRDILHLLCGDPETVRAIGDIYGQVSKTDKKPIGKGSAKSIHVFAGRFGRTPETAEAALCDNANRIAKKCRKLSKSPASDSQIEGLVEDILDMRISDAHLTSLPDSTGSASTGQAAVSTEAILSARKQLILAKQCMTETNLPLVKWTLMPFAQHRGYQDMAQEGVIGLMDAVQRWDTRCDHSFASYASFPIRQKALRSMADTKVDIRIPEWLQTLFLEIRHTKHRLANEHGKWPELEEIAEAMGRPVEKLRAILSKPHIPLSLSAPHPKWGQDHHYSLEEELVKPDHESALLAQERMQILDSTLLRLSPKEEKVLRLRFGFVDDIDHTLEEVGESFDVTKDRIRQIQERALRQLRHPKNSHSLRDLIDAHLPVVAKPAVEIE